MNREIKFRGLHRGGWIYGFLHRCDDEYLIQTGVNISKGVAESSIGQFTGLYDKDGKEIYEGDIVTSITPSKRIVPAKVIRWNDKHACFCAGELPIVGISKPHTIIGNIHENPELP